MNLLKKVSPFSRNRNVTHHQDRTETLTPIPSIQLKSPPRIHLSQIQQIPLLDLNQNSEEINNNHEEEEVNRNPEEEVNHNEDEEELNLVIPQFASGIVVPFLKELYLFVVSHPEICKFMEEGGIIFDSVDKFNSFVDQLVSGSRPDLGITLSTFETRLRDYGFTCKKLGGRGNFLGKKYTHAFFKLDDERLYNILPRGKGLKPSLLTAGATAANIFRREASIEAEIGNMKNMLTTGLRKYMNMVENGDPMARNRIVSELHSGMVGKLTMLLGEVKENKKDLNSVMNALFD